MPRKTPPAELLSRRAFFGAGVFLGTGITSKVAIGPTVSSGFVPSRHSPRIQIEIDGAWSRQTLPQSLQVQVVPLHGALCYSRYVFRICSGLTATFFQMEHTAAASGNDEFRTTLAGHLRMGTEFEIAGPFSIRVDGFATLRFWQRSLGAELEEMAMRILSAKTLDEVLGKPKRKRR